MAMTKNEPDDNIDSKISTEILSKIQSAKNILLHLHPSPDPDSIGSALAMMHALDQLYKKATVIKGDSDTRESNSLFPGIEKVKNSNVFEIDIDDYDLFIVLDSSDPTQISKKGDVNSLLKNIKTIYIDHHPTSKSPGNLNLILPKHTSTSEILYDLFKIWKIKFTQQISRCLFLGIYSDTGGFCNLNTTPESIYKCSELSKNIDNFSQLMFDYNNNLTVDELKFIQLGLNKNKLYFSEKVAISAITLDDLKQAKIDTESVKKVLLSETLRKCKDWDITISMVETSENHNAISMRSRSETYDMTKIAVKFSGGGHRVAAGAMIEDSPEQALYRLVQLLKKEFKQLGEP